jgi:hypothetical protein
MSGTSTRLAIMALAALAACARPQHAVTYRLTVTVSDNGRPVSGSVVRSEDWAPGEIGGSNVLLQRTVHGDAIVLPIRGRLLVVAMAGWDKPSCSGPSDPQGCTRRGDWTPQAAPPDATAGQIGAWPWKATPGPDGSAKLTAAQLPVLVTFNGAPSTASTTVVDAARLDAAFGTGVQVQSATVQQSSDGVTRGVAATPPLPSHPGPTDAGLHPRRPAPQPVARRPPEEPSPRRLRLEQPVHRVGAEGFAAARRCAIKLDLVARSAILA